MLSKIIPQADVEQVVSRFRQAAKIVIVTHVSPDGDALGSSLGLYHFLKTSEKEVHVIVPNAFPDFLQWLPGAHGIVRYDKNMEVANKLIAEADMICCLDFNALSRINAVGEAVKAAKGYKLMVDHHLDPEPFCQLIISKPGMSSTAELIYRLIDQMGCTADITTAGAACIYTGMMTDTGGFTYNSNNREIYTIIGELIDKGIDKDEIYRKVYNTYSEGRLRLMGYVLYDKMVVYPHFRAALICLDRKEQNKFQCMRGDTEGFVNIPLQIRGICFSAFLREDTEKDMIKVSLRSVGKFPCNKLAAEFFGGGGHLNASGGEWYGSMDEAVEQFKHALMKYENLLLKN